jgi:hypothetical protein
MPDDSQKDWKEPLSPRDIELWTRQEITDANRAHELRVKELTEIARACSSGEITAQQANEQHDRYYARWGDALPTISVGPQTTDEQIIKSLDEAAQRRKAEIRTKAEGRFR